MIASFKSNNNKKKLIYVIKLFSLVSIPTIVFPKKRITG